MAKKNKGGLINNVEIYNNFGFTEYMEKSAIMHCKTEYIEKPLFTN